MKMNRVLCSFLGLALVLLLVLSGCASAKPAGLTDAQVTTTTENLLKAIDANDYQKFGQDLSDTMKSAFTQDQFDGLRTLLQGASGNFVSLDKPTISNAQGYAVYRFTAKYSNETVVVTITFLVGGQKVEGLFFDSANIRKAPR